MDRETVVSTLFRSESKKKRDRDQNVVQSFRDRETLHKKILKVKAEIAVRSEKIVQQKLYEAEAEIKAINHPRPPNSDMHHGIFLSLWNFKAGKSTSRMRYAREQRIPRSLCTGSKKLR